MTSARSRLASLALAAMLLSACNSPSVSSEPSGAVTRVLTAEESPQGRARSRIARVERDPGAFEIFDTTADGRVLYGRLQGAVLPNSDQRPIYEVRYLGSEPNSSPIAIGDGPVADAVLAPSADGPVAFIDPAGRLHLQSPAAGRIAIDESVIAGVSFSPDASSLVYVKGTVPELDIHRVDLAPDPSGALRPKSAPVRLTHDDAPDVLPAFSPDGERIAFVSSRTGVPAIWIMGRDGAGARQLTNTVVPARGPVPQLTPFPDGRTPPLWGGGFLVFSDGTGVHAVAESTGALALSLAEAKSPHWLTRGQEIAVEVGAAREHRAIGLGGAR